MRTKLGVRRVYRLPNPSHNERRTLPRDEVFDDLFPAAIERNAALAARGLRYKDLLPLGLSVEGRILTLKEHGGRPAAGPRRDLT